MFARTHMKPSEPKIFFVGIKKKLLREVGCQGGVRVENEYIPIYWFTLEMPAMVGSGLYQSQELSRVAVSQLLEPWPLFLSLH